MELMEEKELEEAISQYNKQLNQIEAVLQSETNDELSQLKEDLVEIIKISEESLLCLKKAKLLKLLDEVDENDGAETCSLYEDKEGPDQPSSSFSCVSEIEKSIAGTRCKAPYSFDWGVAGYYNAMVLSVEEMDDSGTQVSKVRVLFTNPTHRSMLPCPYFLDEKCRFDAKECRYSHGHVVNMADLKAYVEPDFSLLRIDGKCLAKYEDGIWYKATIIHLAADNVDVHYDTYNMDKNVKLEDVCPIEDPEDGSDDDEDSLSECEEAGQEKVIAEFCQASNVRGSGTLGDWEIHTKGIASKLMAKMGYVFGRGLGKNEDGRVEPVEIILLPTGKSLDACAELREKNKLKQPFKRKKIKGNQTAKAGIDQAPVQDVFDFINNTLGGKKGNIEDFKQNQQSTMMLDRRKSTKGKSDRNYNVELFKLEQEKLKLQKMLNKQEVSVSRNNGKDAALIGLAKQKMVEMRNKIKDIERQEKLLKQKIHQNNEHKKLTVF
ncbi:zinc finger CCCH-type with G patch domain-containing protein-like [Dendronephthya gigantea]|uniref:zinc finger CCCH-type with G patch domain-containing protein-like n=1 Tax=Dendronephthya gigantea TaxID=151771 RepID=UPI00106A494F|nr:zinc finger CCCH-type with G patch domain-containing protein-like [Dendronephthya gigantea]